MEAVADEGALKNSSYISSSESSGRCKKRTKLLRAALAITINGDTAKGRVKNEEIIIGSD